tara:strand:- start:20474 stop:21403 length:930 start_codon:yes stop_codon:yes gene_type:complete
MEVQDIYPKLAEKGSCKKYESIQGEQILYSRKKKKYCRNKTKRKTVVIKESPDLAPSQNVCKNSSKKDLKEMALLLNIKEPEKVCTLINSWKQTYKKPNMKQIKLVASILDISYERYSNNFLNSSSKKDYDIELRRKLLDSIEKKIKNNLTPSFQYWINIENTDSVNWTIILLSKIILPDNFPEHSNLKISEDLYKHYLILLGKEDEKKRNQFFDEENPGFEYLSDEGISELKEALITKFSSCVSKFVFKKRALSCLVNKSIYSKNNYDPLEFCKKEILTRSYDNKKFSIPYNECLIDNCSENIKKQIQ